jgi:16S rRNA (uracil1498-N3)-methyltransferase
MARRRFFVDQIANGQAELRGEDAEHLARVLRAEAGQRYEIADGSAAYLAEIVSADRKRVLFRVMEPVDSPPRALTLILLASLIKFDRMELMIEKATELGVDRIVPIDAQRTEKGLAAAAPKRIARWRRIAYESGQQSRRLAPPEIFLPLSLAEALTVPFVYRYQLEEATGAVPLLDSLPASPKTSDTVAVLVGPEGGWTDAERGQIVAVGSTAVSLGPLILRAETAAMAALAALGLHWQARALK